MFNRGLLEVIACASPARILQLGRDAANQGDSEAPFIVPLFKQIALLELEETTPRTEFDSSRRGLLTLTLNHSPIPIRRHSSSIVFSQGSRSWHISHRGKVFRLLEQSERLLCRWQPKGPSHRHRLVSGCCRNNLQASTPKVNEGSMTVRVLGEMRGRKKRAENIKEKETPQK